MCTHQYCPIKEGKCITEKPGWEWAEKFGLPDANETQRRFLIEQSARWNEVVVHEGEPEPNPQEGSPCADEPVVTGTVHLKSDCGCGKKAPSLITKAKTFGKAFAKHAADGFTHVSENEHARRLSICGSCPSLQDGSCLECGCLVQIKAAWASEECPLGKWSAEEEGDLD